MPVSVPVQRRWQLQEAASWSLPSVGLPRLCILAPTQMGQEGVRVIVRDWSLVGLGVHSLGKAD